MTSLKFAPSLETLGERINLSASPMPVLLVIADQRDFLAETRTEPGGANFLFADGSVRSPESGGVNVALADGSVRFLSDSIAGTGYLRSLDGGQTWGDTAHDDRSVRSMPDDLIGWNFVNGDTTRTGTYSGTHALYQDVFIPSNSGGQPIDTHDDIWVDGKVIAAENPKAADYSAIVFVGGWGSSSYQYAFAGTYN